MSNIMHVPLLPYINGNFNRVAYYNRHKLKKPFTNLNAINY